ncbi:unnamed protein product [Meloidogyne enterolobii]|uniref:Uncharacterized protein n=1 Tax=Meloidogyne enterolobii TaxID=390850 RepID=A0ACB1AZL0_MELEN
MYIPRSKCNLLKYFDISGETEQISLNKYTKQGCGKCNSTSIPCRICNTTLCNSEKFFKQVNYCWGKDNIVEQCDKSRYGSNCYYASDFDNKGR